MTHTLLPVMAALLIAIIFSGIALRAIYNEPIPTDEEDETNE